MLEEAFSHGATETTVVGFKFLSERFTSLVEANQKIADQNQQLLAILERSDAWNKEQIRLLTQQHQDILEEIRACRCTKELKDWIRSLQPQEKAIVPSIPSKRKDHEGGIPIDYSVNPKGKTKQ